MAGEMVLVILIVVGILGRSSILATAASILLILKLSSLDRFLPALERRGLEAGLLFLMISVLVPFVNGKVNAREIIQSFLTPSGVCALIGGLLATYLNGQGLTMLREEPELMMGLVVGSIFGIVFLGGIPVGPLMGAAITALLLRLLALFGKQ
jgi:uncharacterized membrane protein (DUF441 family)